MNNAGGAGTGESVLGHDRFISEHLAREVYRLVDPDRAAEAIALIPAASGPVMIEARVPVDRVGTAAALTALGFTLIDTGIQLDARVDDIETGTRAAAATWLVREARPADRPAVERVSGENLTTSRFHLDPRIAPEAASDVKRAWVGNFFEGRRGDRLLVVEMHGHVGGFLLTLEHGGEGFIDLVALDPPVRGTGALGGLVEAWMTRAPLLTRLVVGTQVSNVRSLRAYARLGFRVSKATYVLHYHA